MKVILIWLLAFSIFSSTYTAESACPSYDFTERFTPLRDQDGTGLCWAFAGSALVEEQLCLENAELCGQQVSVIDGHRCYWNEEQGLATKKTGASLTSLYTMCALRYGVCTEDDSPFIETDSFGSLDHTNATVVRALRSTLLLKMKYGVTTKEGCQIQAEGNLENFLEDFAKVVDKLIDRMPKEFENLDIDYKDALLSSGHYTEALRSVFINRTCQNNRIYSQKQKSAKPVFMKVEGAPMDSRLKMLLNSFKNGKSASLGLCGQRARRDRYEDLIFLDKMFTNKEEYDIKTEETRCGDHSVVANGVRFKDGRCQIHIRNSWGSGSGLGGWEDAENILQHTKTIEYIR
jgi:hypothetical protein